MNPSLWISKTGLTAQDTRLATISNNLANVSTVGFKKDRAVFQDLLYQIQRQPGSQSSQSNQLPSGLQVGTGVRAVATHKIFTEGSMQVTQRPLDVAINGKGFFQILMPDGSTAYTRDGEFQLNSDGQVVTSGGLPLQPAITLSQGSGVLTIGKDGIVTVNDQATNQPTQIATLQLVDFINPSGLEGIGDNLYRETAASGAAQTGTPGQTGFGSLEQGSLEASNVSVVEELVDMITTQRAYEMNSKAVSAADQMLQYVTQSL